MSFALGELFTYNNYTYIYIYIYERKTGPRRCRFKGSDYVMACSELSHWRGGGEDGETGGRGKITGVAPAFDTWRFGERK